MTLEEFLRRAHELGVDGVSLESCFIPSLDKEYLSQVRQLLDQYNLERVFAGASRRPGGRHEPECLPRDDRGLRIRADDWRQGDARGGQQSDVPEPAARAADRTPHRDVPG